MVTPKPPTGLYSAALRARRQARAHWPNTAEVAAVKVGDWVITVEDGDLVAVNRTTEVRTVLAEGGEDNGQV